MTDRRTFTTILCFFIIGITGLSFCPLSYSADLNAGIILADDHGKILYEQNREKLFVPASILKILTSLSAIHVMGEGYLFPTLYFFDEDSKNLYIKGFGDPLFTSEVIEQMCSEIILQTKTKDIHHIVLDHTYYSKQIHIPGKGNSLNPYDAPVGALCANFNTIMFQWDRRENRFVSGEPQTPLLSNFLEDIKKTRIKQGRIILSPQQSFLYPGFLMKFFLEKKQVTVTGSILLGPLETNRGKPVMFQSPHRIKTVVQSLLKFSNNFIANQLLLSIGAKIYGPPATLEKGINAIRTFAERKLNLNLAGLSEGSGISRSTKISPHQMMKILINFMPYYSLLNQKENDFFKTGTLSGVRTRAGYISGKDNRLYPYVIMVNQENTGYEPIRKMLLKLVDKMD